jgi:hypothetical protein
MLLADLLLVVSYGSEVPFMDDWGLVPAVAGDQPLRVGWLWYQHNEHRVPLPRLILVWILRLCGGDFRAGMVVNVLVLGAWAAAMILTARVVRGKTAYADAFFPLVLLHWGHGVNLIWSWQLGFLLASALAGGILSAIVCKPGFPTWRRAVAAGVFLTMLPLCGANGLVLTPALGLWLALSSAIVWFSPAADRKFEAIAMMALVVAALVIARLYLVGFQRPGNIPPSSSIGRTLAVGLQFCSLSFGPSLKSFWPVWGALVLGVGIAGAAIVVRRALRQPGEWIRALGLLLFPTAMLCLALAIGWGRAALSMQAGLAVRYVSLAAPLACWGFFTWLVVGGDLGRRVTAALAIIAGVTALVNTSAGFEEASVRYHNMWYVKQDMSAGLPVEEIARRYSQPPFMIYPAENDLAKFLSMMQRVGIGPYRNRD